MLVAAALFCGVAASLSGVAVAQSLEFGDKLYPDSPYIDLISRDIESFSGPLAVGNKFITGGAGEGVQQLRPEDPFEHREQVKSDNVLPAYCEPPNPCPVGFGAEHGCLEEFDNSAEFSRNFQARQQCLCDQEHMFNCPSKNDNGFESDMNEVLDKNGLHKNMIAKKFHEKRSDFEEPRRRKRSVASLRANPYLQGEILHSVAKKDGRNL